MKRRILHKPYIDEELYHQDLHIHTKLTLTYDEAEGAYIGSFDACIDPFDFLIMLGQIRDRKRINKIAFVDHDALMPLSLQDLSLIHI